MRCPSFLHGVKKLTFCVGVVGCFLFVLGAALFGFSWLVEKEIANFVKEGVYQNVVVDSFDADGYKAWSNNYEDGHAVLYQDFYLYNITNIEELTNGATQINIKLLGPYAYINNKQKIDVAFPAGGDQVTYRTWKWWIFRPEASCPGCKETDVIYNINPAYIGALAQTGGELELIVALTGPTLKTMLFEFLWGPFTVDIIGQWRVPIITDAKQAIVASQSTDGQKYFYTNWANATQQSSPLWKGMLVSSTSGTPSGISLTSAEGLWNPSLQYSLLDSSLAAAKVWRKAYYNDTQAFNQLKTAFSLTTPQLSAVLNWISASCNPTLVNPNFTTSFNISSLEDAAFLQWGQGILTQGVSVQSLYPEMNFPTVPEISIWYNQLPFFSLDLDSSKMLLDGPYGLFSALNLKPFLAAAETGNTALLQQNWGVSPVEATTAGLYFSIAITYSWARPNLNNIIAQGNGLFTNRTVHQWLWDMKDPLIGLLSPDAAQVALVVNETSANMARARHAPDLCWTGKSDINKIGAYIKFENQTELVGVYSQTIPVQGTNDAGQFTPFLDKNTRLHSFDDSYLRDLELIAVESVDIKGINALRYEIVNETWEPSYIYDQPYKGFANLTGSHNGATIFLSNAHMYLCDPTYVAKVNGMKELQNITFDTIIIDIEPDSGAVIHYLEALQVNIYLDPKNSFWFNAYNQEIAFDLFYPLMIGQEYSVLTDSDADKIKNNLYFGIKMEKVMFWVFLGVGLGMFVLSLPTLVFFVWKYRKDRLAHSGGYAFVHDQGDTINE